MALGCVGRHRSPDRTGYCDRGWSFIGAQDLGVRPQ